LECGLKYSSDLIHHKDVLDPYNLSEVDQYDCVILQRPIGTIFTEIAMHARKKGIRVLYEMDDNLFAVPKHNPSSLLYNSKKGRQTLESTLREVDAIMCSTQPLADQLRDLYPSTPIYVCHNHLSGVIWGPESITHGRHEKFRKFDSQGQTIVGWQGSATHDTDFKMILPALVRIMNDYPKVFLRMLGNTPPCVQNVIPTDRLQWADGVLFQDYPALLNFSGFDIGLAPVTDSKFNQAKSNLKWLEYSALGIPCVASRVYPYARSIVHGETGYLAASVDEWYTSIKALLDSPELRLEVGQRAKTHVWTNWTAEKHLMSWVRAINGEKHARVEPVRPPSVTECSDGGAP
jgi:glycosyltransferase involved in cell wall biosynthesis